MMKRIFGLTFLTGAKHLILILLFISNYACGNDTSSESNNGMENNYDTLAVVNAITNHIIHKILMDDPKPINSINVDFIENLCRIEVREKDDKSFLGENNGFFYEVKEIFFDDLNGDSENDALLGLKHGGIIDRPDYDYLYLEKTQDGFTVKDTLPSFSSDFIAVKKVEKGTIFISGQSYDTNDPYCCPSIKENFKVRLRKEFVVVK